MKKTEFKPTFQLDKEGQRIFDVLIEYLRGADQLHTADLEAVTTCASIGARVVKYTRIVAEKGEIETYSNGNRGFSPEFKALQASEEAFSRYLRILGVTAQGRKLAGVKAGRKGGSSAAMSLLKLAK